MTFAIQRSVPRRRRLPIEFQSIPGSIEHSCISFDTSGMLSAYTVQSSQHKRSSLALPNFNVPGEKLAFEATRIKPTLPSRCFMHAHGRPDIENTAKTADKKKNGGYPRLTVAAANAVARRGSNRGGCETSPPVAENTEELVTRD